MYGCVYKYILVNIVTVYVYTAASLQEGIESQLIPATSKMIMSHREKCIGKNVHCPSPNPESLETPLYTLVTSIIVKPAQVEH